MGLGSAMVKAIAMATDGEARSLVSESTSPSWSLAFYPTPRRGSMQGVVIQLERLIEAYGVGVGE